MSEESKSWYKMNRPLFNSGAEDDELLAYGIDGFLEVLDSALGRNVDIYEKSLSSTPKTVRAIIQNNTSDVYNSTVIRQILCEIGTLRCGQYVKDGNAYWLVSAMPDNNGIYEKAILWKCKYTLRFISPISASVVEYPIYSRNSTQYGTGEQNKEHISAGDSQHLIYIPYNTETNMVDNGFRFLIDRNKASPTAYRVTQVDPISYAVGGESEDGLIQWSVLEVQFNSETDNAELMVADYFRQGSGGVQTSPGGGVEVVLTDLDGDFALAIGEEKRIQVASTVDGEAQGPLLSYQAEISPPDSGVSILGIDGGTITLLAERDRNNVGKTVTLLVRDSSTGSEAEMTINIVNW